MLHLHATPPSNVLEDILGNHVFYEDETGRHSRSEAENRQPNAQWAAALGADMDSYHVIYHLRCWSYYLCDSTRLYEDGTCPGREFGSRRTLYDD